MSTLTQSAPITGGTGDLGSVVSKAGGLTILRGVVSLLFGVAALCIPGYALTFLVTLFGVYACADGVLAVVSSIRMARQHQPWLALLFMGIVGIAAGIATFRAPVMTAQILLYVVAGWAILTGMLELAGSFAVADLFPGSWTVAVSGTLSILVGFLLLAWPGSGMLALVWTIGIYAILYGITLIAVGAQMRRLTAGG